MRRSLTLLFVVCLANYCQAQVNPQNGAAQVNIPLYNYSDVGNRLDLKASLVYVDGNGLKVSEMASCVGTGWALSCGGAITRIQHGEPDDQQYTGTNYNYSTQYVDYSNNYYPDGYLYTTYPASDIIDDGGGYTPYSKFVFPIYGDNPPQMSIAHYKPLPKYLADREQDVFAFSFNGRSGQFVIGKNRLITTLEDSKLKIDVVEGNSITGGLRTRISQFTVTDESGIQYVFKDMKYDYVGLYSDFRVVGSLSNPNVYGDITGTYSWNGPANNDNIVNVCFAKVNTQRIVSKWYLSQIINPLTTQKITFNYADFSEDMNTDKQTVYAPYQNSGSVNVYWQRYKTTDKQLASVVLSNSEKLDFVYNSTPRIDLPGEGSLTQMKVSSNNNAIYSWNFTYGYLVGVTNVIKAPGDAFTNEEKQWARLCLLTMKKTGTNNTSEPPYQFAYNMGAGTSAATRDLIPPMFSLFQDHWGYYNAGVVPYSIPEGSYTAFYPAQNLKLYTQQWGGADYKKPFNAVAKNGILQSITYPMGGTLSFTYEANTTSQRQLGGVRVKTATQYDGINHANDVVKQYNYINPDNSSSGWGGETYVYSTNKLVQAARCTSNGYGAVSTREFANNYIQNVFMTGNFGVASASEFAAAFSSALQGMAISMFITIIVDIIAGGPDYQNYTVPTYTNNSTVAGNSLPWGYARTEEVNLSGNAGKTVYEFSNPNSSGDHPIEVLTPAVTNSNKPRYAPWAYGLPKTVTVYDKDDHIIRQAINHYTVLANYMTDENYRNNSWDVAKASFACSLAPNQQAGNTLINQEQYFPLTGHAQLDNTEEHVYNALQQSTVTTTYYDYDVNFQLKHVYYNNSKGEKIETFYYHPYDYSPPTGVIAFMNIPGSNVINPILSTETYINKSDGSQYLIAGSSTEFGFIANGDIKPRKSYTFQNTLPISKTSMQPFSTTSVVRDPAYFKQVGLYDYDLQGNLVQTLTRGNKLASNIFYYDGKLLAATVMNAAYNDIAYTSFEVEGTKSGAWVNGAAIISDDARTGNRCFNLSDPSNPGASYFGFGGLNSGLTYIVSFWGKSGSACINGYTGPGNTNTLNTCQGTSGWVQGATINGWTYYEKQVSGVNKVSMSGTGLVDEFRIYPVGAQMKTTTYSPLIGKTSECDATGRVTYYLYDDLGRLIKVSDDSRNVLRTYEYNYKQ